MTLAVEQELPIAGTKIALREAARKYGVAATTVRRWALAGDVAILDAGLGQGSRCYVDEHDVARVVAEKTTRYERL